MPYRDYPDALECFFDSSTNRVDVAPGAAEDAEAVLLALAESGLYAAIATLQGRFMLTAVRKRADFASCLRLADQARVDMEERGHHLGYGECLRRALVIATYLWRAGIPTTMKIGLTRIARSSDEEFHAWVECGGRPIAPYCETRYIYELIESISPGRARIAFGARSQQDV